MLAELLLGWIDVAPCRVVSRPSAMHSNASKPYQAQLVAAAGLAGPEAIVTDDPDEVRGFATEIGSDAIDCRYAGRDGLTAALSASRLPDEIADRCVRLAATLGLPFAGIDLRRTPAGDWVCFEVNAMPGYSFYESHTGQPIAAALVRHLVGKAD